MADFRKKKLLYVFHVFFDVNHSGTIERKDFELAIDKICRTRGWPEGSSQHEKTRTTLLKIWEGLQKKADADHDGMVNEEEWIKMWDEFTKNEASCLEWQNTYRDFMFNHVDSSGDGTIDEEEFISVYSSYGLGEDECRKAFNTFTQNNSIIIDQEVFAQLWKQYFTSTDVNAPGNFIFGKTSFE